MPATPNGAWDHFKELQEEKFSNLEIVLKQGFDKLDERLAHMGKAFVDVATNKNVMQLDTVREMMEMQARSYQSVLKMSTIVYGLVITVLIGLKYLAPHWFTG